MSNKRPAITNHNHNQNQNEVSHMRRFGRITALAGAAAMVIGAAAGPAAASTATAHPPSPPGGPLTTWWASGYEALAKPGPGNAASFTHIQANFTVPRVNCQVTPSADAQFRVGIGQGSIERVGVSATCNPGARPGYFAWYQLVSESIPPASGSSLNPIPMFGVTPGDRMLASVDAHGDVYKLSMTDLTTGQSSTVTKTYDAGNNTTAQVTAGPPGPTPVPPPWITPADFGAVRYSQINIVDNHGTPGGFVNPAWNTNTLIQPPHVPGTPYTVAGPLSPSSTAFTDFWKW
jgi:hypothetical protein